MLSSTLVSREPSSAIQQPWDTSQHRGTFSAQPYPLESSTRNQPTQPFPQQTKAFLPKARSPCHEFAKCPKNRSHNERKEGWNYVEIEDGIDLSYEVATQFLLVIAASFVFGPGSPDAIGIAVCNVLENQQLSTKTVGFWSGELERGSTTRIGAFSSGKIDCSSSGARPFWRSSTSSCISYQLARAPQVPRGCGKMRMQRGGEE